MISTPIFTRLLTTSEYGQYNVFNSWLGIITIFVTLNLSAGVYQQGLIKFDQERGTYSSSLQGLTLAFVLIWTFIYLVAHDFWNSLFSLTTVQMMAMMVIIWATSVFSFWSVEQRIYYKYRTLVTITLLVSFAQTLLGIFLVMHATDKVTVKILAMMLVDLVGYTGCFIVQMKTGKTFFPVSSGNMPYCITCRWCRIISRRLY